MLIPKFIHQTTKLRKSLAEPFVINLERMRILNDGWSINVYQDDDCDDFICTHYGSEMVQTYRSINPRYGAARADLFRYLLLYQVGGVYLDIKSTVVRRLNDTILPHDEFILSHWANARGLPFEGWGVHAETPYPGEFQQWHIVAAPRHPFLQHVIQRVQRNIHDYDAQCVGTGKRAVLRTTGPIAYTQAIRSVLDQASSRFVDIRDLGFVYSFLDPTNEIFRRSGRLAHETAMPGHYRGLSEPVVLRN